MLGWTGPITTLGAGATLGLLAQAAGGGQEVAWTGFGVTAGFIGYLTGVVIREKDRQIERLTAAVNAIVDAKDREREATIARKDAENASARSDYLKAAEKLTESFAVEQKRLLEEIALLRGLLGQGGDPGGRPRGNKP